MGDYYSVGWVQDPRRSTFKELADEASLTKNEFAEQALSTAVLFSMFDRKAFYSVTGLIG